MRGVFIVEKVTLNVTGMSCGHCVKAVEGSVGELEGVNSVKVNLEAGTVDVEYNNDAVTLDKIKETIDDQGYDVA
jgi:copper chaperone